MWLFLCVILGKTKGIRPSVVDSDLPAVLNVLFEQLFGPEDKETAVWAVLVWGPSSLQMHDQAMAEQSWKSSLGDRSLWFEVSGLNLQFKTKM